MHAVVERAAYSRWPFQLVNAVNRTSCIEEYLDKKVVAKQWQRCIIRQLNKWYVSTPLVVRHRVLYFSPVYGRGGANGFQ
jgi:hypothetical protein